MLATHFQHVRIRPAAWLGKVLLRIWHSGEEIAHHAAIRGADIPRGPLKRAFRRMRPPGLKKFQGHQVAVGVVNPQ